MDYIITLIPVILVVVAVVSLLMLGYVKAPPDQAFIISGIKKNSRILIGRAGIRIPFLERLDKLYLGQMTVDIKTESSVPTNDFINVNVDAVAKVRIHTTEGGIKLAAKNFLNKRPNEITMDLQDSLQGNMREIIGTLSLKGINTDRDSFSDQVMLKASKDMDKLGIEIVSCNIQNVTDENGLIKDLGADNTALIKRNASIAKAQAERDVAIAQAEADKESNDARIISETEIEQRNNELEIRKAELKIISDAKKAEADAAYAVQNQEQQKKIETATVNAQIARAERDAELKKQEVEVTKQKLDAVVRAQADAERYKQEQKAQSELFTRQKDAEAKLYEDRQAAEAEKAKANAARFAKEQEAEGTRALGLAEADAIRAKALAEAEGIDKKAEAMAKMDKAAILEMYFNTLPEIAKHAATTLDNVDNLIVYGTDGASKLAESSTKIISQLSNGLSDSLGLDLSSIISGLLGGTVASKMGATKETNVMTTSD